MKMILKDKILFSEYKGDLDDKKDNCICTYI